MPIEQAERIAQSQFVWAILFIFLFGVVVRYLVRTSDKRERKLTDFFEKSRTEANQREERLMNHLDQTTVELKGISQTVGEVQKELVRMNDRMDEIEKGR